jgi:hypothetical protein
MSLMQGCFSEVAKKQNNISANDYSREIIIEINIARKE